MAIVVRPVTETFVAEIGDVDLAAPLDAEMLVAIRSAFTRFAVLVFPDQHLDDRQQLAFASNFGPLQTTARQARKDHQLRLDAKLIDVSNLDQDGKLLASDSRQRLYNLGNRLWHTDSSFKRVPAYCSMLHARSIAPVGGQTEFADMRAAYDALDAATRQRIDCLVAEHSLVTSRMKLGFTDFDESELQAFEPVPQVLVRTLPDSGRKALYVGAYAGRIRGMTGTEGIALLDELCAHATQRHFVYTHRWRVHDLVMWDNRCTLHRGLEFDDLRYQRDLRRATVSDSASTCEQMGLAAAG